MCSAMKSPRATPCRVTEYEGHLHDVLDREHARQDELAELARWMEATGMCVGVGMSPAAADDKGKRRGHAAFRPHCGPGPAGRVVSAPAAKISEESDDYVFISAQVCSR
jgi:hypothetical protein